MNGLWVEGWELKMSVESAVYFYKKISEDDTFRSQTEGLNGAQLLSFSKDHDFDFTLEELEDVCEFIESEGRELDMETLEGVVGGFDMISHGVFDPFELRSRPIHNSGKQNGWW